MEQIKGGVVMGIFANIKALTNVQKIKDGGTAYFSISTITNLNINLLDAQKALDRATYTEVYEVYKKMNKCTNKFPLDYEGYLATTVKILKEFDKVAPCELYLGMEPFEAMLVMEEVRKL